MLYFKNNGVQSAADDIKSTDAEQPEIYIQRIEAIGILRRKYSQIERKHYLLLTFVFYYKIHFQHIVSL